MKRLFISLFCLSISLFSCAPQTDAELLGYQACGAEVSGILRTDTGEVRLTVTLYPESGDSLADGTRDAVLSFAYESGSFSVQIEDGKATLSADGLDVPCTDATSEQYLRIASLFALSPEALYAVSADSDGSVRASFGANGSVVTLALDPVTSLPRAISVGDSTLTYNIDEYRLSQSGG